MSRHGRDIDAQLGDGAFARLDATVARNEREREFWFSYCELDAAPPPNLDMLSAAMAQAATAAKDALARKTGNPLVAVDVSAIAEALASLERASASLAAYNVVVGRQNAIIASLKAGLASASPQQVQQALKDLKARKSRFEEPVASACAAYLAKVAERDALDARKAAVRKELDEHTDATIKSYQGSLTATFRSSRRASRSRASRRSFRAASRAAATKS